MQTSKIKQVILSVDTPTPPPPWALLERELMRAQTLACQEFFEHYFDERGYLLCVPRWGGDDGPDDAAENIAGWTDLHALGGPDLMLDLYKKGWEGHLRQYTEAKTVDVPFARDGMYYKEFPVMFDWMHNGEGFAVFFLQGLSDPYDRKLIQRTKRFAGFYMAEDPQADNYDPKYKVIRSMFNGSRGSLLRKTTGLDWVGDPFEVEGRFKPAHGEHSYQQMFDHFKGYNDVAGDHPLNLGTTTLAFNAYALTGETKYRDWILEYVDAWVERTKANSGVIPSNIGLDGTIGGACDGKWYGGVYGWAFTRPMPPTGELRHRPYFHHRSALGFGNALLLTGDQRYADVWRGVLDNVNANAKEVDGQTVYPNMYGDDGWYNYTPDPFDGGALEVYYWSMNPDDLRWVPENGWIAYLQGENPDYPVEALQQDFATLREKIEAIHQDTATPDTRLCDDPNGVNPATVDTLTQLMLGGLPTRRAGYPLHCRLRYFDPERRRAGVPEDVAALVEKMTADDVTVTLVNINQVVERKVVVQGGAHAEHQLLSVSIDGQETLIDQSFFTLRLAPGAGVQVTIKTNRYANQPTFSFPWDRG